MHDPTIPARPAAPADSIAPVIEARVNARDEADAVATWLGEHASAGIAWREMVVVAPGKRNWREPLQRALDRAGIPCRMLLGDPSIEADFSGDHVLVMTFHAFEGTRCPVVAVVGVGDLPWKQQTLDEAGRLLEAAMSGATRALAVSHSKPSALVERLLAGGPAA